MRKQLYNDRTRERMEYQGSHQCGIGSLLCRVAYIPLAGCGGGEQLCLIRGEERRLHVPVTMNIYGIVTNLLSR